MEVRGKAALVTGGSRGLGAALGAELARRGARVVLVARGAAALRQEVAAIRSAGGEAHALVADLGDKDAIYPLTGAAAALVGPLDILVQNASVLGPVPLEELTSAPRASGRLYPKAALRLRRQGDGAVRQLLPDPIPGVVIERMEIPAGGRIPGVPHMPGTREYFTCESGEVVLAVGGTPWTVGPGDVLAFRGDQRHSYRNVGRAPAVGYSVVLLAR